MPVVKPSTCSHEAATTPTYAPIHSYIYKAEAEPSSAPLAPLFTAYANCTSLKLKMSAGLVGFIEKRSSGIGTFTADS